MCITHKHPLENDPSRCHEVLKSLLQSCAKSLSTSDSLVRHRLIWDISDNPN